MRGVAVVVMVMGHSIDSVLSTAARATDWFRLYDGVRGFTAPIFLFVSGTAFTVATAKRWTAMLVPGAPLARRVGKLLLLFVIGYALHIPFFSLTKILHEAGPDDITRFLQVDVLHCVAATMLGLQAIVMIARTPARASVATAIIAAVLVVVTPVVWSIDFAPVISPVLSPYMNQTQISIFPLFPYAGFMMAGSVFGHALLRAREADRERAFFLRVTMIALIAVVVALILDLVPVSPYPDHDFWKTSPLMFIIRLGVVMLLTTGFFFLKNLPPVVVRHLVTLGQASLLVYAVHLLVVYGSAVNSGLAQIVGHELPYYQAVAAGALVLAAMIVLVHGWNYLRTYHDGPTRLVKAGLTSTILYYFITKPW